MEQSPGAKSCVELPALVPLFPLPNMVLFPGAVLPLHIFEERYKQMTGDVLRSHRQVAMALLRAGWEKDYYGRPAIEPVVCVGTILSHERLEGGRYNFLLQGHTRANVVREEVKGEGGGRYRVAELRPVAEKLVPEGELVEERGRLIALFEREAYVSGMPGGRQFKQMLAGGMPTAVVADLLAFHALPVEEVGLKQSLLAEGDVTARVRRVAGAMEAVQPSWRNVPTNASMN
jgi:Lon protease-like protein